MDDCWGERAIPFSSPPHRSVKSLGDMCMVVFIFCTGGNVI
jgi:hypothetical protein